MAGRWMCRVGGHPVVGTVRDPQQPGPEIVYYKSLKNYCTVVTN